MKHQRETRSLSDEAAVAHAFNALAEGGNIGAPLTKPFWSLRLGISWMVTKPGLPCLPLTPESQSFQLIGPIIVNIIAFHLFIAGGKDLFSPLLIVLSVFALYLLWAGRQAFCGLLGKGAVD